MILSYLFAYSISTWEWIISNNYPEQVLELFHKGGSHKIYLYVKISLHYKKILKISKIVNREDPIPLIYTPINHNKVKKNFKL